MSPVLKYRGGKAREIPRFAAFFPKRFDRYIEPFLGGGAVYFYLEPRRAVLCDISGKLMTFYRQLRDEYPRMRKQLGALSEAYARNQVAYRALKAASGGARVPNGNEALYYRIRELYNRPDGSMLEGVSYYFINKTAFSGMIRHNREGEYNVPFGRYPRFNAGRVTEAHSALLQTAELIQGDYSLALADAGEEDFAFLDPPYDCVFNDYGNPAGFGEQQHRALAEAFRSLRCKAMLVIGKTPLTESLYRGMIDFEYPYQYAVNIKNRFSGASTHMIVRNYR